MREFLDGILAVIDSESLTDEEFEGLSVDAEEYSKEVYDALRTVLEARENVSGQVKRLTDYFTARGVDLSSAGTVPTPASNILIGGCL